MWLVLTFGWTASSAVAAAFASFFFSIFRCVLVREREKEGNVVVASASAAVNVFALVELVQLWGFISWRNSQHMPAFHCIGEIGLKCQQL